MEIIARKAVYNSANYNVKIAPRHNEMGMPTVVKITHAQTYGQFSYV